ncbi:hypothetical protein LLT7_15165 [Lactococcus cremoris subsp. cremoris TIFN7]|nr:hypothetical protein LLT7_15165 [Lactococcus cremoris subsp. cremoris TIFN7]
MKIKIQINGSVKLFIVFLLKNMLKTLKTLQSQQK